MLGLRSRSQLLHTSCCSSWCSSAVHPLGRGCIQPRSIIVRSRVCCDAGKRPGGAGRPAKDGGNPAVQKQPDSKSGNRQGHRQPSRYENAPATDGSAMQRMITVSIREISSDSSTALQELADVVNEWGSSFNVIHTSAAFTKAAKLRHLQPAAAKLLLDTLAGHWDCMLPSAGPQALANVLWACSKLRYTNERLWSNTWGAVAEQLQHNSQEFNGIGVANTLHGLANASTANKGQVPGVPRAEAEPVVQQLMQHMRSLCRHPHLEGVEPQHVANVMWACAKLRINPDSTCLDSMLAALARPKLLEAAEPQHFANALWATSELRQHCGWQPQVDQRVLQRLLGEVPMQRVAEKGSGQEVSNLALSLARLSVPPPAAAPAATATSARAAAAVPFLSQDLAQQCTHKLLQGKAAQQLEQWQPQDISNSLWACSRLGMSEASFLDKAAAAAPVWLRSAVKPEVVQVAIACTLLHYNKHQLMEQAVKRTAQLSSPQHKTGPKVPQSIDLAASVAFTVATLDLQQLAGDARNLVARTQVTLSTKLSPADARMFWSVHQWLVQQQLLDGQGLAGLLSPEQLAEGQAEAEAYQAWGAQQ